MPKGIALTLGLNAVDPPHYAGWSGELLACEADANDMAELAQSKGLATKTLLTQAATRAAVRAEIERTASALSSGDLFLLTYSGHGGQLPDLNSDEPDAQDETWCLYDGELVDDETYALLSKFARGVRILVFSDSCHSGSAVKLAFYGAAAKTPEAGAPGSVRYRFMPPEVAQRTYRDNRKLYDSILRDPQLKRSEAAVRASVILISGCQDNQLSADGTFNGLFTANLLQVWNQGKFKGDYRTFHRSIVSRMPPNQTPNYFRTGQLNRRFEKQRPFTV